MITTAASVELARLVMLDSAGLPEEEARYQMRKARRQGNHGGKIEPLYTILDALNLHATEVIMPELHQSFTL